MTEASNKHEIAMVIARRFPQLIMWLPPKRKLWMTEDYRTNIFGVFVEVSG